MPPASVSASLSSLLETKSVQNAELALEYPALGVVSDLRSKKYLIAPDYWNYWGGPTNPYFPAGRGLSATSPPATWWEQRSEWRDTWERLATGDDQPARWKLSGKRAPTAKERCVPAAGLLKEPDGSPNLWWQWLEKPKSASGAKGLAAAAKGAAASGAKEAAGLGDLEQTECPKGIRLDDPVVPHWGRTTPLEEEGKREDAELEEAALQPGAAKGASSSSSAPGSRTFDPSSPPPVSPEQEAWLRAHTLRRQTLPGYPRTLLPDGLQTATPRLSRFEASNQPATLDPRLLDPPLPPNRRLYSPEQIRKQMTFKIYDGKLGGGLMNKLSNVVSDKVLGGTRMEYQALARVLKSEPDWLKRYHSGEILKLLHKDFYADESSNHAEQPASAEPGSGSASPTALEPPLRWSPPPPPDFAAAHRAKWDRFWPQLAGELQTAHSATPTRQEAASLGRHWSKLNGAGALHSDAPAAGDLLQTLGRVIGTARDAAARALGAPAWRAEAQALR